jgi:hypothetical protein
MNHVFKEMQHLLLWRLAAGGGEEFVANLPGGKPDRTPLLQAGLITEGKRVNPTAKSKRAALFASLTENGWGWCQDNMTWPAKTRSTKAGQVLHLLLPRLRVAFDRREAIDSLGDFIAKSSGDSIDPITPDLHRAIRDACRVIANGRAGVRIRLAELREQLSQYNKDEITRALWELSEKGELSLWRLDDPREIQTADREAAVLTSTGEEKHILYFGGTAS